MINKLKKLYFEENKSLRMCAEELGIHYNTVKYQFKKHNIKTRSKSEATKIAYAEDRRNTDGENNPNYKDGKSVW